MRGLGAELFWEGPLHHHHQEPVARCPGVFQGVNLTWDWGGLWGLQQETLFFS